MTKVIVTITNENGEILEREAFLDYHEEKETAFYIMSHLQERFESEEA